jgi:hypothetical protein
MGHCEGIRTLSNARAYLFRYYGGVYATFIISQTRAESTTLY